MLKLIKENIPEELKKERKWVVFEITPEGGKTPKDPKPENLGENAKINDPSTWGSFEQAASLVEQGLYPALGYAMVKGDKLIFLDVDCHDEKCCTKEEKDALRKKYESMRKLVETYGSYMEQSVSGTGVHLLARGVLSEELAKGQSKVMPVEIYDSKFIIMTGHRLNDCDIEDNPRTLGAIHNLHKANFQPVSPSKGLGENNTLIPISSTQLYTDEEVLEVAMKNKEFELLWSGQWDMVVDEKGVQKYSQQHYADFVLIRRLTFYTGNFPTQVERLFKKSPCYQQYGKNGKWSKYESDIRKDIKTASTTCYAVYNVNYKGEKIAVKTSDTNSEDVEVIDTQEWRPNFHKVWTLLSDTDPETRVFKNPELVALLKDYVVKYADKENIRYIPYLFKEDKNINGAANILQKVAGDTLKYSYKFGAYFIWDGKRYKNHGDPEVLIHPVTEILGMVEHSVFHWIMTYVAKIEDDTVDADTEDTGDTKGKNKKQKSKKDLLEERAVNLIYQSKKYVSKTMAVDVLKKYKGMSVGDDLVTYYESPYINLQNGVLDLTTRELHPHHTKFNMSKITNCDYDPLAVCPTFETMVANLIPDAAARKEMQKAFGLCLAKEHLPAKKIILLLVGPKDTGKTTLLNTVVDVLGEYGTSVDNSLLMQNTKDKTRGPEMYDFFETLMITTSENSEKDKLDASKIKALSGQTTQSIRNNYATKMDKFKMIGLIWIDSNFKPYLNPRDMAAWDRLRLFELPNPIKVKDVTLPLKLEAEKAGIFNWMLKGLDMVLEEKAIFETEGMLACKEQYRKEMDTTDQFLQDCVVATVDKSMRIPTTLLYITYKNWVKDNNFHCTVRNKFYEEVAKVFDKKKSGNEFFVGIRFSELGELYSTMTEKTPTEFAKRKREILVGSKSGLPYRALRAIHFQNTQGWFYMVNEFTDRASYINYCSWCAEEDKVPIKVEDFEVKIDYLKKHLHSQKAIRRVIEDATEIWSD